jgi:hypothetical protein
MMALWTIYERPYPLQYVARLSGDGPPRMMVSSYLEPLQAEMMARGLHRLPRHPDDVPEIVEVWLDQ